MAGETVDVFFVALKRLTVQFGGLFKWTFLFVFLDRTPGSAGEASQGVHEHRLNAD